MDKNKDLIFYSSYCQYSTDLIKLLIKYNLKDHYTFICVDNKRYNIPLFITKVPTLLKLSGEVISDNDLYEMIDQKHKTCNSPQEISPLVCTSIFGNPYSSCFSSLDGSPDMDDKSVFQSLGTEQVMINIDTSDSKKKNNDTSVAFEKLMADRQQEECSLKKVVNKQF
jgi:hypothetical protein